VVICFGGSDEYKDELLHEMPRHAFPRASRCCSSICRSGRQPSQAPASRSAGNREAGRRLRRLSNLTVDVDSARIALYGASLAASTPSGRSFEHRLACVVSDGAIWDLMTRSDWLMELYDRDPMALNVRQLMWLTGTKTFQETIDVLKDFKLEA